MSSLPAGAAFRIDEAERRVDRFFAALLWAHFAAALLLAFWYQTWAPALVIGLPAALIVTLLARLAPGSVLTRCAAGAALLIFSALYIQQTHGLTEAHFHVFCALAFLLAYRDWRVPTVGAAVIIAHHAAFTLLRVVHVPVYVYTSDAVGPWALTIIHAAFVIFEAAVLSGLAVQMRREWRQAEDLSRLTHVLTGGALTGDDLTARLDWGADSPIAAAAASVDGLLERLRSRIDAAKTDAGRIREQALQASRQTEAARHDGDIVRAATTEVSHGATEQARQAAEAAAGMAELTAQAQALADAARHQAGRAQEMAAATDSLCARTAQVAEASGEQAAAAGEARAAASQAIRAVTASADATWAAVDAVTENVGRLGERSADVRGIAETVGDIAARTNLLALNAAIEAARAGEAGRGFAVVADEVRKLADQSARAALQIDEMIAAMTREIAEVLRVTQGTAENGPFARMVAQAEEVIAAGERTEQLAARISTLAERNQAVAADIGAAGAGLAREIASLRTEFDAHSAAAGDMASGAAGVHQSLDGIAAITEQSSAAAEQAASVVAGQSEALRELMGVMGAVTAAAEAVAESLGRFRTSPEPADNGRPALRLAA